MILYLAALRYDPQKPVKIVAHISNFMMTFKVMKFIRDVLQKGYPELYEKIDWENTTSYEQYEQYIAFTTPGARPVEFEYLGEFDTHA